MTFGTCALEFLRRAIVMQGHFDNDRDISANLVDLSDYYDAKEDSKRSRTLQTDWNEAVVGWKNIVPFPVYNPPNYVPNGVIRRKTRYEKATVEFEEWLSDKKASVKCVGDDFDEIPIPEWKANVEQGTYRYVANNGYYRTMKFLSQNEKQEWYTVTKRHPEKVSMSWQNRRFQKELKRQLKKDLRSKGNVPPDGKIHRERTDLSHRIHREKTDIIASDRTSKREAKARIRSVQSEAPPSNRNKSPYIDFQSPTMNDNGQEEKRKDLPKCKSEPQNLDKTAREVFIDNFATRISALERELVKDTKIRKVPETTTDPSPALPVSPKTPKQPTDKESDLDDVSTKKSKNLIQQEIMTVRSMIDIGSITRHDLRPIEKVTPAQRLKTINPESSKKTHSAHATPSQIRYTTSTGSDAASLGVPSIPSHFTIASPELEKALHSYKVAIETTKQSLLNTLSGPKHARRAGTKNLSAPAAIAICDDPGGDRARKDAHAQSKSERRNEIRKRDASFVVLPEISGKRMEVSTTTNRWL
ncbi:hypothetical protein FSP39_009986 [Pinctada imbricata]|uniref:Uncharacterized protein n=1 Tax=Pinctada imbricata TaxID=66713 RepID=A0AA88XHR8_PINIB|nr:hypothetical protein FSP39_009986 [Pinctada imbricata]